MEKILKKPKLTKKQRGFVEDYALDENGTKAALKNYNTTNEHTAAVIASENLTKPEIVAAIEIHKETLKSALEKQGVTPAKIALKVDELLNNEDPNAIDKGLKHAKDIYGVADLDDKPKGTTTYNQIFNIEIQKDIKEIEARIKDKLLNNVPTNQETE